MKLSFIQLLFIAISFQVSWSAPLKAQLLEKRITVNLTDQKLEKVLKTIAAKADIRLVYNNQVWKNASTINAVFTNAKVGEVLDKVLQASDVTYEVINDQFIVLKPRIQPLQSVVAPLPVHTDQLAKLSNVGYVVSGIVTDEHGDPLPGVTVRVKDGIQSGTSNLKGRYVIGLTHPNSTIEFSFIGYRNKSVVVNAESVVNIQMQLDPAKLDEVVIIGYGTTTRRTSTGATAGISAKEIEEQPVTNALLALEGKVPGVFVTQSNGLPGAGVTVQVRGVNSLAKSNRPLYIIDGVPFLSEPINTASSTTSVLPSAEGATSPMNSINPADIENIEVLKDADATAIYGSRGANGVVLITTKKGKDGKTRFGATVSTGISKVGHYVDMMDVDQYLALRKQAFANDKITPTTGTAPDLLLWDQNTNTNWQKKLLGNTAHTTDATANVSGGDALTNFYLSGTYHKEGNVFMGDQGYERGGANFSLNHSSSDRRFNLALSAIYSADKNNISTIDQATYAYNLPPNFPLYNADGSLYWTASTRTHWAI